MTLKLFFIMKKIFTTFLFFCVSIAIFAGNSKIQFINNSADSSFAAAQIKIGDSSMVQNLAFRNATAFLSFPYDTTLSITFIPKYNAGSLTVTLNDFHFQSDSTYVCFLNGVGDITKYDANPDGASIELSINVSTIPDANTLNIDSVGLYFMHGATDLTAVDIKSSFSTFLTKNLAYNHLSAKTNRLANAQNIDVTAAGGTLLLSTFNTKFDTINGQNVVVFFSGFLSPSTNQNGANFSAFAAFQDGKVYELRNVTAVQNLKSIISEVKLFPNPTKSNLNISFQAQKSTILSLQILNINGSIVQELPYTFVPSGKFRETFNTSNLSSGIYFLKIADNQGRSNTSKFIVSE